MSDESNSRGLLGKVKDFLTSLYEDPALRAAARLGWKELGNAFDPSRDGSVTQPVHEYGMPFTGTTPGEIGKQQESLVAASRAAAGPEKGPEPPSPERDR